MPARVLVVFSLALEIIFSFLTIFFETECELTLIGERVDSCLSGAHISSASQSSNPSNDLKATLPATSPVVSDLPPMYSQCQQRWGISQELTLSYCLNELYKYPLQ